MTGISPGVIRVWERRYGFIAPSRSTGRYRLYREADIALLRAAKRLVDAGRSIGDVARMEPRLLLSTAEAVSVEPPVPAHGAPVTRPRGDHIAQAESIGQARAAALNAIRQFDAVKFDRAVAEAVASLSPIELCRRFYLPLLEDIGAAWERGALAISGEHFGSSLVRAQLIALLDRWPRAGGKARVVCACPAGEMHEGALLAFAVHAAASGWDVVYLGGDMPAEDVIRTVDETRAQLLAVSLTLAPDLRGVEELTVALNARRLQGPFPHVVMGGAAARAHRALLESAGIRLVDDVGVSLDDFLPAGGMS